MAGTPRSWLLGLFRGEQEGTVKAPQLNAAEVEQVLRRGDVLLLDVREPGELKESGTIKGYVNIPLGQLESRLDKIPKDKVIVTL